MVSLNLEEPLKVGVELVKRAFFIVIGYFFAQLIVGYVGKAAPQVAAFGNWAVLGVGLIAGMMLTGPLQELALGAALLGAINIISGVLSPFLTSIIPGGS